MGKFEIKAYLPISTKEKIDLFFHAMHKYINNKKIPKSSFIIFLSHIKRPTLRKHFNHKLNEFILERNRLNLGKSENKKISLQAKEDEMILDANEDVVNNETSNTEFTPKFSSFDYSQADYSRPVGLIAKKN